MRSSFCPKSRVEGQRGVTRFGVELGPKARRRLRGTLLRHLGRPDALGAAVGSFASAFYVPRLSGG